MVLQVKTGDEVQKSQKIIRGHGQEKLREKKIKTDFIQVNLKNVRLLNLFNLINHTLSLF